MLPLYLQFAEEMPHLD